MIFLSRLLSISLASLLVLGPANAQSPFQSLQLRLVQSSGDAPAGATDPRDLIVEVTDGGGAPVADATVTFHLPDEGATGVFADGNRAAVVTSGASGHARISGIRWGTTPGTVALRITASKGSSHAGVIAELKLDGAALPPVTAAKAEPEKKIPVVPKAEAVRIAANNPEPPAPVAPLRPASVLLTHASAEDLAAQPSTEARVSISTDAANSGAAPVPSHGSKKKWIIVAVIAAGAAGGAVAFLSKSKTTSTSTTSPTAPTIGTPTISIGLP